MGLHGVSLRGRAYGELHLASNDVLVRDLRASGGVFSSRGHPYPKVRIPPLRGIPFASEGCRDVQPFEQGA